MTRNRKVDPDVLEREYIYDAATPPVSYQKLAERHGLAKNTVAEQGSKGRWNEKRIAFRRSLGIRVTEALADEWAQFETAARQKLLSLGMKYLDQYEKALLAGQITMSTRDALGWAAAMRTLAMDEAASNRNAEEGGLIDPDNVHLDPDEYRRALAVIEQLEAGNDPADAGVLEATGTEGSGPD